MTRKKKEPKPPATKPADPPPGGWTSTTVSQNSTPVEEWQVSHGHHVHIFRDEERAKAFVKDLRLPWDRDGFTLRILVRHIVRHHNETLGSIFTFTKTPPKAKP